jgi:hypothetical protein
MRECFTEDEVTDPSGGDAVEALRQRLGELDQRQIVAWQEMSPARRLEIAFQAYQFALDTARLTEQTMEPVRDYKLKAFFTYVVDVLERMGIPYMIVGGFATIFYGEPRLTIDVYIIVGMKTEHIGPSVAAFPIPDYLDNVNFRAKCHCELRVALSRHSLCKKQVCA